MYFLKIHVFYCQIVVQILKDEIDLIYNKIWEVNEMLGAIIKNEDSSEWSQLYINKSDGKISLSGFSLYNGILLEFDKRNFEIFKSFILGPNRKSVGKIDGFDAVLDETTGLYYFFKDGKEDFEKMFFYNSTPAEVPIKLTRPNRTKVSSSDEFSDVTDNIKSGVKLTRPKKKTEKKKNTSHFRKFILKNQDGILKILYVADICAILLAAAISIPPIIDDFVTPTFTIYFQDETIEVEKNVILNDVTFIYDGIEQTIDSTISPSDIENLIYRSPNLETAEKDFLWNPELIQLVTPYYNKYDNARVLAYLRHKELEIESFTGKEYPDFAGFYNGDDTIHVRNYDVSKIVDKGPQAHTAAHEYGHLLQFGNYSFLNEACATILAEEFYLDKCVTDHSSSYLEACKYTRVLMEIVGTDPILDALFYPSSKAIEESTRLYLNEFECAELCDILKMSPYYTKEELKNGGYARLYELLSTMYYNKYGSSIEDDKLIDAIVTERDYRRVYFRESLRLKGNDYYTDLREGAPVYSLKDAWLNGYIVFVKDSPIPKERYISHKPYESVTLSYNILEKVVRNDNGITEEGILKSPIFTLTLDDGTSKDITLEEAESLGYVDIEYFISNVISYDEYVNQSKESSYHISPQMGYIYDSKKNYVYATEDLVEVEIESITSKLQDTKTQIS